MRRRSAEPESPCSGTPALQPPRCSVSLEVARTLNHHRSMDNNVFSGKWKQFKGNVKDKWGKLTDDDVERVEGKWENLVGRIQERYGKSRDEADKEAREYFDKVS